MKGLKNLIVAGLLCLSLLITSGCDNSSKFLKLSSVPSVTVKASTEIVKRYFDGFNGTFTPSDEYGTLIPFVGDILEYQGASNNGSLNLPVYGLCTLDGTVVVDPVYDNVIKHELQGGTLYELLIGSQDPSYAEKRFLISSDGKYMMQLNSNQRVTDISGDKCFAIARTGTIKRNKVKVTVTYYDFYNYKLKLSFRFNKALSEAENTVFSIGNFSDLIAPVNVSVTTKTVEKNEQGEDVTLETTESYGYYINSSGKKVFQDQTFNKVGQFYNGLAVVVNNDGLFGVIKTDGTYLFEPNHKIINYNFKDGYFAVGFSNYFLITDLSGETIKKVHCENANIEVIGTDKIIYKKTFDFTGKTEFFSAVTGDAFVCDETGLFPDSKSGDFGVFTSSYSNVTDVFGTDGVSIAQFADFGSIKGVWGEFCVLTNGNNEKTAVLNINSYTKTDWIDGRFVDVFDGRYLVLQKEGKLSLYDALEGVYILQEQGFMEVTEIDSVNRLNVVGNGHITVYGDMMKPLLSYRCDTEVAR